MAWWNIFSWFKNNSKDGNTSVDVISQESKPRFINTVTVGAFFTSNMSHRLDNGELVSSVFEVSPEKMNNFPISSEGKVLDMKLRNQQHQFLQNLNGEEMNEMMYAILMNHMRVNSYKELYPDLYNRVFVPNGERFAIAYCLAQKQVLEKNMEDLSLGLSIRGSMLKENFDKNLMLSFYQDAVNFMRIMSQIYPAFAKDLIQLNVFENFFKTFNTKMLPIVNARNMNIQGVVEAHNNLINLMQSFVIRVIEKEGELSAEKRMDKSSAGGDFRESIFYAPLLKNGILELPCDKFNVEANMLLQDVRANLNNVSASFFEEDLSNEVPKMFNDVLGDMIKNFMSMPEAFRNSMSNDNGKTVEMMLIDVLKVINNRLIVIAQDSHKDTLREVSVIDEFSQKRWENPTSEI